MTDQNKKCGKCLILKSLDNYCSDKRKSDGLTWDCKKCSNEAHKKYAKSKKGVIATIYSSQRLSSRSRMHSEPNYDLKQLKSFILADDNFHKLYDNWVMSGFLKDKKPSIDRIDDYKPYTFDNIQLMTWGENHGKMVLDTISGINNKKGRPVCQYTKDGKFINEFFSISNAVRNTGVLNISNCCTGKNKTAGGFVWRFK